MLQLYINVYIAFGLNALCSASIAILLGHLRVSYDDVKKAVLSCDTQLLSIERLQQMEKYAPNKKEVIKRIVTVIFYNECSVQSMQGITMIFPSLVLLTNSLAL